MMEFPQSLTTTLSPRSWERNGDMITSLWPTPVEATDCAPTSTFARAIPSTWKRLPRSCWMLELMLRWEVVHCKLHWNMHDANTDTDYWIATSRRSPSLSKPANSILRSWTLLSLGYFGPSLKWVSLRTRTLLHLRTNGISSSTAPRLWRSQETWIRSLSFCLRTTMTFCLWRSRVTLPSSDPWLMVTWT